MIHTAHVLVCPDRSAPHWQAWDDALPHVPPARGETERSAVAELRSRIKEEATL